jgi:hypothetical protein
MMNPYKAAREEEKFFVPQRKMARRASKQGRALTEEKVDRIVFEDRPAKKESVLR